MHRLRESDIFMWYWLNFTKFGQRIICKTEEVISANFGTFHCNFPSKIDIPYLVTLNKVLFWSRDIENIILWKNVNRVTRSITTFKHSIVIYETNKITDIDELEVHVFYFLNPCQRCFLYEFIFVNILVHY